MALANSTKIFNESYSNEEKKQNSYFKNTTNYSLFKSFKQETNRKSLFKKECKLNKIVYKEK